MTIEIISLADIMKAFNKTPQTVACRTCGYELNEHARFNRWTLCPVCYWKLRMDHQQPIEDLVKRRSEVALRLQALPKEIDTLRRERENYYAALKLRTPWWRKLWEPPTDETLESQGQSLTALKSDFDKLAHEQCRVDEAIEAAKNIKKRLADAQIARNAEDARKRAKAAEHDGFCNSAIKTLREEFDRKLFYIQRRDYRRGNTVDNYFRHNQSTVFAAFNKRCVSCGGTDDLTLDHYALCKNEGGNFVLIPANRDSFLLSKESFRLNIIVLCRRCNSEKAQRSHHHYFSEAQREALLSCQRALLEVLLADEGFLKLIRKWAL